MTSIPPDDQSFADKYEVLLEIAGSVVVILLGLILWVVSSSGDLWRAIAPNLVAAGALGLLVLVAYGRLFRKRQLERVREQTEAIRTITKTEAQLDAVVRRALDAELLKWPLVDAAQQLGVIALYRDRPTAKINEELLSAQKTINILEISLNTMRGIARSQWQECGAADIRILLLDPYYDSPHFRVAIQRDREEDKADGTILREIHRVLGQLPEEWCQGGGKAKVKLAQTMPTMSYFRIDDTAYFSPYVHKQIGDATLHLKLAQGGQFLTLLDKHFQALWDDAKHTCKADPKEVGECY